jgi:hypothetical protein
VSLAPETVAFKIPNKPIDRSPERFFTEWDSDNNLFYLQFYFQAEEAASNKGGEEGEQDMDEEVGEEDKYEIEEDEESHSP